MSNDVNEIAHLLEKTEVRQENIVSFKKKGLKLNTGEDAKEVVEAINKCVDVQVLELEGNTVGVEACQEIAKSLKNKSELQKCLWPDMFTGRLRSEIPPALRALGAAIIEANAHLVEFDLSHNAFGPDGIKACVDLLRSKACYTLETLRFNNNGLGIGGKVLAETLIECHTSSKADGKPLSLKVFVAGRNRLENRGAIALAKAFKTIGTLEEIHMPQNGITHEGISALAEAVTNSKNLKHLNLNDNTFTSKGAEAMANAIKKINSLEIINFGDCLVRTNGAVAIGQALAVSNPDLKELILSFGEIHYQGAMEVCTAVADKEHLKFVSLNGNQIGEMGIEDIKKFVEEKGFKNALDSLDEDEGSESDSDRDEEEEEESESNSEEEEEQVVKEVKPQSNIPTKNGYSTNKTNETSNGELSLSVINNLESDLKNFANSLNVSTLRAMSDSQRKELLKKAVSVSKEPEDLVDDAIKIAGFLSSRIPLPTGSKNTMEVPVLDCVNAYLKAAFDKVPEDPMRVVSRILIRFGLIKSENKKIKPFPDAESVGLVLFNGLKAQLIPAPSKKVVRAMVAKDNDMWDKYIGLRNRLLELLY